MTTSFVLIPGAGGMAWHWHRVTPRLRAAGHEAIAVDLPGDDESMGLRDYAERVAGAIGGRSDVVLVAHSLGGFTAPLVLARKPVRMLVFVNAMIPDPNETAGAWWGNTGSEEARLAAARAGGYTTEFDLTTYFLHDVRKNCYATVRGIAMPKPDRYSPNPVASSFGLRCRSASSPRRTTASSRRRSKHAWRGSA